MSLNATFKGFKVERGLSFFCMSTVGRIRTSEWELESGRDQIDTECSGHHSRNGLSGQRKNALVLRVGGHRSEMWSWGEGRE